MYLFDSAIICIVITSVMITNLVANVSLAQSPKKLSSSQSIGRRVQRNAYVITMFLFERIYLHCYVMITILFDDVALAPPANNLVQNQSIERAEFSASHTS
jgi:hypothetical protein